jgi:ABC-type lipoprotein export system ATPase subunit
MRRRSGLAAPLPRDDAAALIELRGIAKRFRGRRGAMVQVIAALDLSLAQGEALCVIGGSGAGKTTLMEILGLLCDYSSGSYRFEGQDVARLSDAQRTRLRRDRIGFVFQSFQLLPRLTALDNVLLPLRYRGGRRRAGRERARALLDELGLAERATHRPEQLSGGEQQRVAIARALINDPRLIIADEPTGNLDESTSSRVLDLLFAQHARGRALIVVTHDPIVAGRFGRVLRLGRDAAGHPCVMLGGEPG